MRSFVRSFVHLCISSLRRSLVRSFRSCVCVHFVRACVCVPRLARLALHFALYYYDFFLVRALRIAFVCLACTRHDSALYVCVCVCVCVHFPRLLHVFAFLSNVYCLTRCLTSLSPLLSSPPLPLAFSIDVRCPSPSPLRPSSSFFFTCYRLLIRHCA